MCLEWKWFISRSGYARLIDTALMFSASASSPKKFVVRAVLLECFLHNIWISGRAALHRGPEVGNVIHVVFVGSFRKKQTTHLTLPFYMHIECCIIYLIAIDTFKVEPASKVRFIVFKCSPLICVEWFIRRFEKMSSYCLVFRHWWYIQNSRIFSYFWIVTVQNKTLMYFFIQCVSQSVIYTC